MRVESVSHDAPNMPGMHWNRSQFGIPEDAPVILNLAPTEERMASMDTRNEGRERIVEPPREKVRIKTESQGERDAEIIRPMMGGITSAMMTPFFPTMVLLSVAEFNELGRPTIGDKISITIDREK